MGGTYHIQCVGKIGSIDLGQLFFFLKKYITCSRHFIMTRQASPTGAASFRYMYVAVSTTSTTTDPAKGRTTITQQPDLPHTREQQHRTALSEGFKIIHISHYFPHLHAFPSSSKLHNLEITSSSSRTTCIEGCQRSSSPHRRQP